MAKLQNKELRDKVLNKYDKKCAYCGCDLNSNNFQVDHISPLFRGSSDDELKGYNITRGLDDISNYNPSCASCNITKSTWNLEQFRAEIKEKVGRQMRHNTTFRLLLRYDMIEVYDKDVVFYFESFDKSK